MCLVNKKVNEKENKKHLIRIWSLLETINSIIIMIWALYLYKDYYTHLSLLQQIHTPNKHINSKLSQLTNYNTSARKSYACNLIF